MEFQETKEAAIEQLLNMTEDQNAILMITDQGSDKYQTININISNAVRYAMMKTELEGIESPLKDLMNLLGDDE